MFCQRIAAGMKRSKAYEQAGYKGTGNTADVNAGRMLKNAQICSRVAELMIPDATDQVLTKKEKREFYRTVVRDPDVKMTDRLRASELDAKIAGDFAPEQHVVETGPKTLDSIRERAGQVAAALDRNAAHRAKTNRETTTIRSGLSRWTPEITVGAS